VRTVDLRSDTVTKPTPEMRRAIAGAEVGDDVWGDDPTVIELEREVASMLGKQAALYVPSGSMGNLICVRAQTRPGDEILLHEKAHVAVHEQGSAAALAGVQTHQLTGPDGVLEIETLERNLRDASDIHHSRQALVCVENTLGEMGGLVYPQERIEAIAAFAHAHGMRVHMDGARLWNAAVASGKSPAELAAPVDTLSVCFSKGLGAPVGSAVAGSAEFVATARRNRKLLGGGMRQAGIIAAGALHALRHHVQRLADDHRNARLLAEGLDGCGAVNVQPERVATNIVLAAVTDGRSAQQVVEELGQAGVLCGALDDRTVRFVTHLDVDSEAISAALEQARPVLS
jgi:threonine aldolase